MVGPGVIFNENACVAEPPALSVTLAVKLKGPDAVGVPVTAPLELSNIPCGSEPLATNHVKPVPLPPVAIKLVPDG